MAKEKGEVVAVVREWNPQHDTSLTNIHAQIDAWGRRSGEAPTRDYAEVEAAVDRITKRVKSRKVTVHETVTEYVEVPVEADAPAAAPIAAPQEESKPKKRFGLFGRRKSKAEEADSSAPPVLVPSPALPPPAAEPANDAWDPGEGRPVEAPKPLQSKAAKRTARQSARKPAKGGRKKR